MPSVPLRAVFVAIRGALIIQETKQYLHGYTWLFGPGKARICRDDSAYSRGGAQNWSVCTLMRAAALLASASNIRQGRVTRAAERLSRFVAVFGCGRGALSRPIEICAPAARTAGEARARLPRRS